MYWKCPECQAVVPTGDAITHINYEHLKIEAGKVLGLLNQGEYFDLCISCQKEPVTWPRVCDGCQDHEAQAELAAHYLAQGDSPDEWRCRSCGMIYDGGMRCTYCGDADPTDSGEPEGDEGGYFDEELEDE